MAETISDLHLLWVVKGPLDPLVGEEEADTWIVDETITECVSILLGLYDLVQCVLNILLNLARIPALQRH